LRVSSCKQKGISISDYVNYHNETIMKQDKLLLINKNKQNKSHNAQRQSAWRIQLRGLRAIQF